MGDRRAVCAANGCWQPMAHLIGGVALCASHLSKVKDELSEELQETAREAEVVTPMSVVYYVTFDRGETVKIGTSTSPLSRLKTLARTYDADPELLAAEPGHIKEERAVHRRFVEQRVLGPGLGRQEFFRVDAKLKDHMRAIREGNPRWQELPEQVQKARGPKPPTRVKRLRR